MTKQYIHIDSSYRNRLLYPNPSDFVVPYVSPTGTNITTYMNPVSKYLPIYNFVFPKCSLSQSIDFFDTGTIIADSSVRLSIVGGNSIEIVFDPDDIKLFLGDIDPNVSPSCLVGLFFVYGNSSPYQSAEIKAFDYLSSTITLNSAISLDLPTINYGYIYNSSTNSNIRLNGDLRSLLVYNTPELYIFNSSTNEIRTAFQIQSRNLELESPFTFSSWTVNDFYVLFRIQTPSIYKLSSFDTGLYYSTAIRTMKYAPEKSKQQLIIGSIIELYFEQTMLPSGVTIKITKSFTNNHCFEIITNSVGVQTGDVLVSIDMSHVFYVLSSYQVFKVNGRLSNAYKNTFFTPLLFTPLYESPESFNDYEIPYNIFPLTFTDYCNVPENYQTLQNKTGTAIIYNLMYQKTTDTTLVFVSAYDTTLLERFQDVASYSELWDNCLFSLNSNDQYNPLNYSGSNMDESVCYEIELTNLILPNTFLNGLKVLTSFYPYFLVEFSNLSYSYHNINNMFTNNPNANKALFPIPISDVSSPLTSQFLNLSCPCSQTIKFKPNDSFRVRVFFPNGDPLTPFEKDTLLPYEPDPSLQISILFSIRRLVK